VLGEGEEDLLLGGGVGAALERPDEEAADDLAVAGDGGGHGRPQAVGGELGVGVGEGGVVLGDDQLALDDGPPGEALLEGGVLQRAHDGGVDAGRRQEKRPAGVRLVDDPQGSGVVAEQLGGALRDRVEHLADRLTVGDRLLDAEEALEKRLALLENGDEPLVLLHVAQGLEPQGPLVVEGPEHLQRLGQHPAHAPQQHRLLGGERVAGPGDEEGGGAVDGNGHGGAGADVGDMEDGRDAVGGRSGVVRRRRPGADTAGGGDDHPAGRDVPGPEPDRGQHLAVAHDGRHLSLEGLGRPFHGAFEGGRFVLVGRHGDQELGDLLRVPSRWAGHSLSSPPGRRGSGCGSR
jgi:hypothetical protein